MNTAVDATPGKVDRRRLRHGSVRALTRPDSVVRRRIRVVLTSLGPSSILIGVVSAIAMLVRLFVPAAVGIADNGEGQTIICQLGLAPADAGVPRFWSFAILDWVPAGGACEGAPSSGILLLEAARWITALFGGTEGALNLRVLIVGYALLCGALIGLLAFTIRRGLGTRIGVSVLLFALLADGAFAGYAGGVYADFAGLVGIAILSVAGIYLAADGTKQWVGLAMFTVGATLAILSTPGGFVFYIPVAVLLICTTVRVRRRRRVENVPSGSRALRTVLDRIVPVGVALLLLVPTLLTTTSPAAPESAAVERWQFISLSILAHSPDPAADLDAMGLPTGLEMYAGISVWEDASVTMSAEWGPSQRLLTQETITGFLLTHPDRLFPIMNNAAGEWFHTRSDGIGSYEAGAGLPPAHSDDSLLKELGTSLTTMGVLPLIMIWGLFTWAAIHLLRRSAPRSLRRGFALTALLLISISIMQFVTVAFTDPVETPKPLVLGIFALALSVVTLIGGACATIAKGHPAIEEEAAPSPVVR